MLGIPDEYIRPALGFADSYVIFFHIFVGAILLFGFNVEFRFIAISYSPFPCFAFFIPTQYGFPEAMHFLAIISCLLISLIWIWHFERSQKILYLHNRNAEKVASNLHRVFESATTPMFKLDIHGNFVSWNKVCVTSPNICAPLCFKPVATQALEIITGCCAGELEGANISTITAEDDTRLLRKALYRTQCGAFPDTVVFPDIV